MWNTLEMLVMAQYNIARHGGVETIEVSIISAMTISYCLVTAALAESWGFLRRLQLTRRASLGGWMPQTFCSRKRTRRSCAARMLRPRVLHEAQHSCLWVIVYALYLTVC